MRTITFNGKPFYVADEPSDFWGWVQEGRYNQEWDILSKFVRPEHTVLDLGAWVGSHSLFAATIAKRVIAVEPDPVAYAILEKNVVSLGITSWKCAISGYDGIITLGSGLLGASTTRANQEAGGGIGAWVEGQQFDIPCTTLRQFVEKIIQPPISGPLFIKMDVEGSEEQILEDTDFFAEHKPTMCLELHPFWWKSPETAWESVRKVGRLYKHTLDVRMNPIDLSSLQPRVVILTD